MKKMYSSNNFNDVLFDDNFIVKIFQSKERYLSETENAKIFSEMGFLTAPILKKNNESNTIVLKKIENDAIYNDEYYLEKTIEIISNIAKLTLDKGDVFQCRENYYKLTRNNFFKLDSKLENSKIFKRYLDDLYEFFHLGLFKDCKPDNFIYQKNKVYVIDFDYVRSSFFLADLAQFLSYYLLFHNIDVEDMLFHFLDNVNIRSEYYEKYGKLLYVAIINSSMLGIEYNPKLNRNIIEMKKELIDKILHRYLGLI